MRTPIVIRAHQALERVFPERRLFLKSDSDTRFIRLRSSTQAIAAVGVTAVVSWAIVATAVLLMDSIGSGNFREQARRDQQTFQQRLNALAGERDSRAAEAAAAQERFNAALAQISVMQSVLLDSETRREELETGIEVIQSTLRKTMQDRETIKNELTQLQTDDANGANGSVATGADPESVALMADALADTAQERDQVLVDARNALDARDELELEIKLMQERNDQIFRQLEEAMAISVEPLDKLFRDAGMAPDRILEQIRKAYDGQGGPLTPITFSTRSEEPSADELRVNRILDQMDELNLYRMAADKVPFAMPVHASVRYTSGFGYRRDPKTGGRRLHKGSDFAGTHGTDVFATAEGVVTHAGWQSGYGRLIRIQHEFGTETYYAHLSNIRVKKGQRVSRGDHIGDMGNTGRSTGTHLHYEVRVNGAPVNPMTYIKAARDVFEKQNKRARIETDR
ncbi:M23 family metallopeptidase [Pukyongiella litopenaei]|uniref:Peptidoglycan DD-metalloendopeptidase family protein n=1 Tax=Pukyongiella litopenaei TaxID=2605946 RepID=A0A2S0MTY6_9RHOB|nr:M23 family metallopeptidase [Pukyongiella litopenaei]AVO39338.1 peptidoglycan DD-metalloendopeptidase family protein [Pukyongiella litopenaei]